MSRVCWGDRTINMRNPSCFLLRRVVNLFQELKPKCSHMNFEKAEAAEHN